MSEHAIVREVRHSYNLAHATPTVPELNGMFTEKFENLIHKKDIQLPAILEKGKFCEFCGVVFIPVVTLKIRIVFGKSTKKKTKKKKEWKARERKLRYECLTCKKFTDYDILKPTKDPNATKVEKSDEPFVAKWEPKEIKKPTSGKERAKKRKKNNLSNLLNAKKEKESNEKKIGSILSLEEFMKN